MNKLRKLMIVILIVFSLTAVNAQDNNSKTVITLERTACFGTCPVYTVNILDYGTVIYEGNNFVTVTGKKTSEIAPETVATMVEAFKDAGYFDWKEAYDNQTVSDLPSVITSVTVDGITHKIRHYTGDHTAPLALTFLEQWIDQMTNTSLWTGVQPDVSAIPNGTDTPVVTLQQGPNFGRGMVYNLAVYEDGTVVFTGIANVNKIGVYVSETDASRVSGIVQQAQIFGYFEWQDSYEDRVMTDQATIITSVKSTDQSKRIVRYDGDPNAPIGLLRIEENINRLVADYIG